MKSEEQKLSQLIDWLNSRIAKTQKQKNNSKIYEVKIAHGGKIKGYNDVLSKALYLYGNNSIMTPIEKKKLNEYKAKKL